jgi:hypothetical protein
VTRTFPTAGTYVYNCHIHPGMRGTVVVSLPTASRNPISCALTLRAERGARRRTDSHAFNVFRDSRAAGRRW